MLQKFTIIYAFRNRDAQRVNLSLQSLQKQTNQNFEVIFVDYGSEVQFAKPVKETIKSFAFAKYNYVAHEGLLWNKSKALNYGISLAQSSYVILADVDVLFAPHFIESCLLSCKSNQFSLFKIGYLPKGIPANQMVNTDFSNLKTTHIGHTFGIGLFPTEALKSVKGLDPFFHFYGSEDEDLNSRLTCKGYQLNRCKDHLLWHQWHPRYPQNNDKELSVSPRLQNVQRINQQHFLWNKKQEKTAHSDATNWTQVYFQQDACLLKQPDKTLVFNTVKAHVMHFLNFGIQDYQGQVVKVVFKEDAYYKSLKYQVKKLLKKETQPYVNLKYINDRLLEQIIFKYKHANYAFYITKDRKEIHFTIDLKTI